jgi:putative nucleotidyltransferase with HDIG domain
VPVPVRSDFGDAALTSTAVLDRILRHQRLQAIPPVLHHVLSLTHSSTSSIKEIADAVRNDPALAVTVMKIANSSFYAGGKRVQTLPDAAQRVGISSIANTITAVLAFEHFSTSSGAGLVPQHFWEHSLATAVLSEQIAKTASADNAEHLFLAGLLHDIGRIMLCEAFPAEYAKVLARSAEVGVDVVEVEPRMFGLTHADVTREILRHLKLPNAVIDAAWQHELPIGRLNGQQRRSALIVAAGNRMAHALAFGDSGNTMLLDLAEYAEPLDLSLEKMKVIAAESEKVMEDRKLFYASQSDEAFCTSLTADLSKIGGAVRTAVLPATQFAAGLALFCHQMKWLDERKPRVAVLVVRSEQEAKRCGTALAEIDEKLGRKAGVLLASPNGQIQAPAELREGRTWGTAAYPGRYAPFAEALARVTAESEPTAG